VSAPEPRSSTPSTPSTPAGTPTPATPAPFDTRRYGRMVGGFAAVVAIAFLAYSLTTSNRSGTAGVPAGAQLRSFAAPLALSTLNGDANVDPPCTLEHHDHLALNVCLLVRRAPLVLAFFVTRSAACERGVGALQALAATPALRGVQFAAVAVQTGHAAAAKAVRSHGWTIPVAYDADGAVGALYGVTVCPLFELARRGGVVADRLIGEHWLDESALAARVRPLLGSAPR